MKKPAQPAKAQAGFFEEVNAPKCTGKSPVFQGTDNPRELRLIHALLSRPSLSREAVDSIAGCANGPDLVRRVRELGLGKKHLPCTRISVIDRDGVECKPGSYSLTIQGRKALYRWLAQRGEA